MQNADDLFRAMTSEGGIRGVRVSLVDASHIAALPDGKLEGITSLNNFSYEEDGLRSWRALDIGEGKKVKWSQLQGKLSPFSIKRLTVFASCCHPIQIDFDCI